MGWPAIGKAASSGSCSSRRQFGTHRIQKQAFLNGGLDQGRRGNRKQGRFNAIARRASWTTDCAAQGGTSIGIQANRCYDSRANFLRLKKLSWCPRRDSNSHDRSRGILSPLRLPIPPLGPGQPSIVLAVRCQFCRRSGARELDAGETRKPQTRQIQCDCPPRQAGRTDCGAQGGNINRHPFNGNRCYRQQLANFLRLKKLSCVPEARLELARPTAIGGGF